MQHAQSPLFITASAFFLSTSHFSHHILETPICRHSNMLLPRVQAKEGEFIGATLTMHDDVFVQLVSGEMDAMMVRTRSERCCRVSPFLVSNHSVVDECADSAARREHGDGTPWCVFLYACACVRACVRACGHSWAPVLTQGRCTMRAGWHYDCRRCCVVRLC